MNRYTFKDFFKDAIDLVYLNFIFLAVVLLGAFITFGAAFKALFFVVFRILDKDKQNYVFKSFFKSFKENFLVSTTIWLIIVALGFILFKIFEYAIVNELIVIIISCLVSTYLLIVFVLYLYPIMSIFKTHSVRQLLKNTFIMSNSNLFTTIKLLLSLVFVIGLFQLFTGTILFSFGIFAVLISFHLKKVFIPYLKEFEVNESNSTAVFKDVK